MPKRVSMKGRGADIFFGDYQPSSPSESAMPDARSPEPTTKTRRAQSRPRLAKQTRGQGTAPPILSHSPDPTATPPPEQPVGIQATIQDTPGDISQDSVLASTLSNHSDSDMMIQAIRKIIRVPGREVSFIRLTAAEKQQLADIVYTYKRQGRKTTETEVNRIAVNFILEDYRVNGSNSVLARVLDALLA
jgi:hypothetical protein